MYVATQEFVEIYDSASIVVVAMGCIRPRLPARPWADSVRLGMEPLRVPVPQCPAQLFRKPHPARDVRGQGFPRPVAASLRDLESWKEVAPVRSVQR